MKTSTAIEDGTTSATTQTEVSKSVEQYINEYLHRKRPSIKASTFSRYRRNLDYVIDYMGDKSIHDVDVDQVNAMYVYFYQKLDLSACTINTIHRTFHTAIKSGVDRGELDILFTSDASVPAEEYNEITTLDDDEVRRLIGALDPTCSMAHYHAAIYTAVNTGMRQSEILGLRWSDLHIDGGDGGHISVNRRVTIVNGQHDEHEPKSASSRRKIALSSNFCTWMKQYKSFQTGRTDSRYCFTSKQGNWLWPSNLRDHLYNLLDDLGIDDDLTFHDLRDTHATLLLERKVPAKVIQERLGHSSLSVTMDRYSHVTPAMQDEAVETWSEMIV